MYTNDLINVLEDYLSSNQHPLLIAYVDDHTSSLHLVHSVPSNLTHQFCYFIRKNNCKEHITSINELIESVRFGYINGKSIPSLTSLISTLFGPLFLENMTIQDSISLIKKCIFKA